MSDIDNPIIRRLEALLADVTAAEQRLREAISDSHTATKTLHTDRKAFLQELDQLSRDMLREVEASVQRSLNKHMAHVDQVLNTAAQRAIKQTRATMEMILEAKQEELRRMKSIGGSALGATSLHAPRVVDTETFPGLKSGE